MNDLVVPSRLGALSSVFGGVAPANDELSAGIGQSFAIVSYRGKVWAVKFQGNEKQLLRDDGDGPRNSIEVVIVKAADVISKIWYEQGYVDGSNAPPDCWSTNGQTPDPASPKKQSTTCAGCPRNAWGSKVTDAGKQGKECADSKRVAIVPVNDMENEAFGGPMLLRVPAASLKDVATYANQLNAVGYPYFAVATRIAFDTNEAFPKFVFNAIRALTDEEGRKVMALRDDERVKRILNVAVENVTHEPEKPKPTVQSLFETPPAGSPAAAVATPVAATPAAPVQTPSTAPAEAPPVAVVPTPVVTPVNWVAAVMPDGSPVWYDQASGATKPREVEPPKPVVVEPPKPTVVEAPKPVIVETPAPAPAAPEVVVTAEVTEPAAATGVADFDNMLEKLMKA